MKQVDGIIDGLILRSCVVFILAAMLRRFRALALCVALVLGVGVTATLAARPERAELAYGDTRNRAIEDLRFREAIWWATLFPELRARQAAERVQLEELKRQLKNRSAS